MRIKGWHLIGLAAVVFLLDFFTLGNRNVIDNQIADIIAFIIGLICVLVFLFGIIKTLCALFSKNTGTEKVKREQEHEQGNRATGVEIGFRRILAGLLIISVVPANVLFPIIGLIITLPFLLLALYLLFNRQYHLIFNCFLVLPGCLYYFVNFNILPLLSNQSYFSFNKIIELSACPGLIDPKTTLLTQIIFNSIPQYLFFTASLFLLAANIIARLKLAHKTRLNVVALFIICLVLLFLPFLYVPQVALGDAMSGGTGGQPLSFFVTNKSFHMSYDQALNTYIYTCPSPGLLDTEIRDYNNLMEVFGGWQENGGSTARSSNVMLYH